MDSMFANFVSTCQGLDDPTSPSFPRPEPWADHADWRDDDMSKASIARNEDIPRLIKPSGNPETATLCLWLNYAPAPKQVQDDPAYRSTLAATKNPCIRQLSQKMGSLGDHVNPRPGIFATETFYGRVLVPASSGGARPPHCQEKV